MGNYPTKINPKYGREDTSSRSFALTKKMAHEYFKAKKNKKKLPVLKKQETVKDDTYKKLSIKEWEKKYL